MWRNGSVIQGDRRPICPLTLRDWLAAVTRGNPLRHDNCHFITAQADVSPWQQAKTTLMLSFLFSVHLSLLFSWHFFPLITLLKSVERWKDWAKYRFVMYTWTPLLPYSSQARGHPQLFCLNLPGKMHIFDLLSTSFTFHTFLTACTLIQQAVPVWGVLLLHQYWHWA